MRHVLDHEAEYTFQTYGIAATTGIVNVLGSDFARFFGSDIPTGAKFGLAILAGPILGLVGVFVGGFLSSVVGRVLGGEGTVEDLRPALAWGVLPATVTAAVALPLMLVLSDMLEPHLAGDAPLPGYFLLPSLAVLLAIGVLAVGWAWSLVTMTKCVAEAHRFSAWRALAIPFVLILPLVVLAAIGIALAR